MVVRCDKQAINGWSDGVTAREADLTVWRDVAETSRAVLFEADGELSETDITHKSAFGLAAKAVHRKQGIEYLFFCCFEERRS